MKNNTQKQMQTPFIHVNTTKFKDITVMMRMMIPISKENTTCAALYLYMVEDRNQHYPTKKAMLDQKDRLYGTTLSTGVVGYGDYFALQIASKVMDPSFGDDETLLDKHAFWFESMVFSPLLTKETLEEAKQQVASSLYRDLDQPSKYAQIQAFKALGEERPIAINLDGDLQTLESVTLETMQAFAQYLHSMADRQLYVIGHVQQDQAKKHYAKRLLEGNHSIKIHINPIAMESLGTQVEVKKTNQSQMVKLIKTNVTMDHPLYLANRVAVAALGQLPTSLLFMEVREKRSLCYSIGAQYIAFDGLCVIKTGIDQKNIELVDALIDEQVDQLKQIDDSLLQQAKTMLINAINTSDDELLSFINVHYAYRLIGQEFDKQQVIQQISALTKLDITQAVSLWENLLVYTVKGENNHEANHE